mgnify:CR=1 FL=1
MKKTFEKLLKVIFPERCACCNRVIGSGGICTDCKRALNKIEGSVCPLCGRRPKECNCRQKRHAFVRCIAPFCYQGPVSRGLKGLKFYGHRAAAGYFAREMANCVRERYQGVEFDLVVCVPLSAQRMKERGYNQSELLAAGMAKELALPFAADALQKLYDNPIQHSLTALQRRGNVLGVYEAKAAEVQGKRILLVDDIATTGATLHECAKMLCLSGAKEVYAVTAALVNPPRKDGSEAQRN